ncbi:MAG: hypothetical protein WDN06_01420 [Asticcacaulis sp.]
MLLLPSQLCSCLPPAPPGRWARTTIRLSIRGLIDGLLAPVSFVLSLFSDTIRMYQFPNIGRCVRFRFPDRPVGVGREAAPRPRAMSMSTARCVAAGVPPIRLT